MLRQVLYRYGWDGRCRHREALAAVREVMGGDGLLDVGCGPGGLAAFLPSVEVTGVDLNEPTNPPSNLRFVRGSITSLPFEDRTFGVVASIDTIENLTSEDRTAGIRELMRVARRAVVIACPNGELAARSDSRLRRAYEARNRPVPEWVREHESHPYPSVESVVRDIGVTRHPKISVRYSEPLRISSVVRSASARSRPVWATINLAAGVLLPILPEPGKDNSYRFVVRASLD
jgi:SAM-dependent methyltransferase